MSYCQTAYNSKQFIKQNPPESEGLKNKLYKRGQILPFSQTNCSIATSAIRTPDISVIRKSEETELFWTHEHLQPYHFTRGAGIYLMFAAFAKFALLFAYPFFFVLFTIAFVFGDWKINQLISFLSDITLYLAIPALIVYSPILWINRKKPEVKQEQAALFSRKDYSLNRQTGMVTLYDRNNKELYTYPFIEFDCVLTATPTHQGLLTYRLTLLNRYSPHEKGINIGLQIGINASVAEYHRLWNMIQQYMDTSQPMPDIPILEPFRAQDQTTAEYDQKTGRASHYWRSMTDEEFTEKLDQIAQKQHIEELPASGPELNIFTTSA
ncbi:hypothetical protein [Vibrio quintilis]|uniref:Uncharacterized protein n=1 Tax=Vibrio quintilis TaxID=1117707 RepID=A0A1M7Z099_9VIBR|nr:hypothetical protein [Vibrio quintilis]SHO58235.1 hypothetical protein VQ7734_04005 [Vibrio quintilis]